jgi:NAD(P)H dehydrogenase (quinone)
LRPCVPGAHEVLPPFVLYGADRMTREDYPDVASGDYEIPSLQLKDGLEPAGRTGFGLHARG